MNTLIFTAYTHTETHTYLPRHLVSNTHTHTHIYAHKHKYIYIHTNASSKTFLSTLSGWEDCPVATFVFVFAVAVWVFVCTLLVSSLGSSDVCV
jgi:hypothetical protein